MGADIPCWPNYYSLLCCHIRWASKTTGWSLPASSGDADERRLSLWSRISRSVSRTGWSANGCQMFASVSVVRDSCQYILLWVFADGVDYFGKTFLFWRILLFRLNGGGVGGRRGTRNKRKKCQFPKIAHRKWEFVIKKIVFPPRVILPWFQRKDAPAIFKGEAQILERHSLGFYSGLCSDISIRARHM